MQQSIEIADDGARERPLKYPGLLFLLATALFCVDMRGQAIPSGTPLEVRLDATVSSATAQVGDVVAASLADNLTVDGKVLASRGTPVCGVVT